MDINELMDSIHESMDKIAKDSYVQGYVDGTTQACEKCCKEIEDNYDDLLGVMKVVHNGLMTIVEFTDGSHTKVVFEPVDENEIFDAEKAVMAAMLKRLVGNSYLKILDFYETKHHAIVTGDVSIAYSLKNKINKNLAAKVNFTVADYDADLNNFLENYATSPYDAVSTLSDDDLLFDELNNMNNEIDLQGD